MRFYDKKKQNGKCIFNFVNLTFRTFCEKRFTYSNKVLNEKVGFSNTGYGTQSKRIKSQRTLHQISSVLSVIVTDNFDFQALETESICLSIRGSLSETLNKC